MSFNFQRHMRIAGTVVVFVGLYFHNWTLIIVGNLLTILGYMHSIAKIEKYVEDQYALHTEKRED